MDKAGDILKAFLSFYNLEKGHKYVSLFSGWRQIAGDDLASHTRVADIRRRAMIVEVDHPGWMQLLQMKQEEIVEKIGAKFPDLGIRSLQMKLVREGNFSELKKRGSPSPQQAENQDAAAPDPEPPPAVRETGTETRLDAIKDEELRNLLRSLGGKVREKNRKAR
mgnify:FL=1